MIKLNLKKYFKNFELIYRNENYSKFNISPILGLNFTKSPPRNPTNQGLSKNTKILPQFVLNI
jgi:hypothetical protein